MFTNKDIALYAVGLIFTAFINVYTFVLVFSHRPRPAEKSELKYKSLDREYAITPLLPLPVEPEDDIELSVVIPCFNETQRLKGMLQECVDYLTEHKITHEVLIIDDGSDDNTGDYLLLLSKYFGLQPGQLRVVKFVKNRGKGGAVAHGMKFIRGRYGIFCDADGASRFSDIDKLFKEIRKLDNNDPLQKPAVLIGSRAHMVKTDAVVKRSFTRNFLMYGLHFLVYIFGIRNIKDTQCGFKLFNRSAISQIFPQMYTEGWIFDVEVLILAMRKSIPILECPISWHEVDGSKMDLARDSIWMAIDLVVIRLAYLLGIYQDNKPIRIESI